MDLKYALNLKKTRGRLLIGYAHGSDPSSVPKDQHYKRDLSQFNVKRLKPHLTKAIHHFMAKSEDSNHYGQHFPSVVQR